ncbi:helix-turn-helix domain-containing protein [Bradyrhizobium sp. DASA03120]|uniref:helix-turn-helix domain-containing protein n=1 Tax=Bradyrhizobium sp. SMVTL-02 TaxID=3395917 RepID=UPI003F6EA101
MHPWRGALFDIEVCVDVCGNGSLVTRQATGIQDSTVALRDTVWVTPPNWHEGLIAIANDLPEIMHIYLPPSQFTPDKLGLDIDESAIGALRYDRAFRDPLLGEIARAIVSELQAETSAGRPLVEALANSMAARLIQTHARAPASTSAASPASEGLDRRRLARVLDYIEANLEGDLTLDGMASIACLSRYHFARAFKQAVGQTPHRYVSVRRLDRAKALLTQGDRSLVDIALALSFSDQASFTRAFRQATGRAPGQYRREFGSRQHDSSSAVIRQGFPMLA